MDLRFSPDVGTTGLMNRAIDTATWDQGAVGCIDDDVDYESGDVVPGNGNSCGHRPNLAVARFPSPGARLPPSNLAPEGLALRDLACASPTLLFVVALVSVVATEEGESPFTSGSGTGRNGCAFVVGVPSESCAVDFDFAFEIVVVDESHAHVSTSLADDPLEPGGRNPDRLGV